MQEMKLFEVTELTTMAQAIAESGLFGMKNPQQALALMLVAQAEGKHPATITQDYDIIQGRACRKSHSLLARFQQMGGVVKWETLTDETARASFSHSAGGVVTVEWTIEMAKKAGLAGKDNWKKYPRAMLRARCISEGVRSVYPAAIGGMLVAEEAQDMPRAEIDMGQAQVVEEPAGTAKKIKRKLAKKAEEPPVPQEAPPVIDEETGELFDAPSANVPDYDSLIRNFADCDTLERFEQLRADANDLRKSLSAAQQAMLRTTIKTAEEQFNADTSA